MPETLPWGGTHRGPEEFKAMVGQFIAAFEQVRPLPDAFLEADDHVVVTLLDNQRGKGGEECRIRALWLYRLEDRRIVRAELFADTASTLQVIS